MELSMRSVPQRGPGSFRNVAIAWAVVSVILIILTFIIPRIMRGLPVVGSDRMNDYNVTLAVFTILAAPVWSLVVVFAAYSYLHFRSPTQPLVDGPPLRASRQIQFIWVGVSVILVIALYAWGLIFLNRADAAPAKGTHVLNIDVTGEQWNWDFTYPDNGYAQSETLEVPINVPILFKITSLDVDHSFSVTQWGMKEDAVPGTFTYIRVTPNKLGNFEVRCYELCGLFHAYMEEPVRVVSMTDFNTWVQTQPRGTPFGIGGAGVPGQLPDATPPVNQPCDNSLANPCTTPTPSGP
jgi:cytochrome c oxidase subunit 2